VKAMSDERSKLLTWALLCVALTTSALTLHLNYKYNQLYEEYTIALEALDNYTVSIDIMIDDGTHVVWYNNTRVAVGASLLDATLQITEVEYQTYDIGAFVTSLNGLSGDSSHFWLWSKYEDGWVAGSTAADHYTLHDGDILAWIYTTIE